MGSIVSWIGVVLVNRELSDGSVNWLRVRRRYYSYILGDVIQALETWAPIDLRLLLDHRML